MKRLTSILAISVIAVMSAGAARADIASTTYVDNKVTPVSTQANTNASEIETLKKNKEDVTNKVKSGGNMQEVLERADADTKYPTLKAALAIAQIAAGAATEDLGDLTARVGTAESNITSLQSGKQNKLVSGENGNINGSNGVSVTVGTDGKIAVSGNQDVINTALENKQDKLDATQLAAANSGITLTKVATYDGYDTTIKANTSAAAAAKSAADAAQATADSLKTSKQDKLSETQLNAANSGITEAKVATYDGYGEKITTAQNTANAAIAAPKADTTSTDGVYTLTMKVVNGTKTYAWEQIGR